MLQLVFLLTCPLLVAAGTAWFTWRALGRPWLFTVTATVVLYVLYIAVLHIAGPASVGFAVEAATPGNPSRGDAWLPFLATWARPLLVFLLLAAPTVLGLLRVFKRQPAKP